MKTKKNAEIDARIMGDLTEIAERLSVIESYMVWTIKAEQRFRIGQRVEWSSRARARGFPKRKAAQKGVVKDSGGFGLIVQLDGMKRPSKFHHSFFNPVSGPKLF